MKTDGILTVPPLRGKVKLKKSVNRVFNSYGALIGGVSAYGVFDLNGKKIARFAGLRKTPSGEERRYLGERAFVVKDGLLYTESGTVLGNIEQRGRAFPVTVAVLLCVLIAVILAIVAILGYPVSPKIIPVLEVSTDGEEWGVNQDLDMFEGSIYPGVSGSYSFEIKNPSEYQLEYTLTLSDKTGWGGRSPLEYRLRMNNVYIGETNGWTVMSENDNTLAFSEILFNPYSSHIITVEWRWPFESGNDQSDTQAGSSGGKYFINVDITAAIVGQP